MSELNNARAFTIDLRLRLLTTTSALILIGAVAGANAQADEGRDRPVVWIELGGQAERMPSIEDRFAPPFSLREPRPFFETASPLSFQHPPRYSVGGEGKLSFEPLGSDWVFSASVRYGRSNGKKRFHNQVNIPTEVAKVTNAHFLSTPPKFEDTKADYRESHTILDFEVGKDVGLGLFGDSVASLGVRYAQFGTTSTVNLSSRPDFFKQRVNTAAGMKYFSQIGHHRYTAASHADRSFHGIGPSLSLTGAVPIVGRERETSLTFDWGLSGALLFGRQRVTATHNTYGYYHQAIKPRNAPPVTYHRTGGRNAGRSITVPDIGGVAGISYRLPNAKLSFGYRADFFFGAMDRGLDARESSTMDFHGPFATVSFGFGG